MLQWAGFAKEEALPHNIKAESLGSVAITGADGKPYVVREWIFTCGEQEHVAAIDSRLLAYKSESSIVSEERVRFEAHLAAA